MIRILGAWLAGTLATRAVRLCGVALGIALAAALLAALTAFASASARNATATAAASVPVDWIVEVPSADAGARVETAVRAATGVRRVLRVDVVRARSLSTSTADGEQRTGSALVVTNADALARAFPGLLRTMLGSSHGVAIAQQTASNLHASVGTTVTIDLPQGTVRVRVDRVVDLAAPAFAAPIAGGTAPDDVLFLPDATPLAPASARTRYLVAIARDLPSDPLAATAEVRRRERNLSLRLGGIASIADPLAAALDAARADALYGRLLFLFFGAPGVVLAAIVTIGAAWAGVERRRRDRALLGLRGAGPRTSALFLFGEGALVALLAVVAAVPLTIAALRALGTDGLGTTALATILICAAAAGALWIAPALEPPRANHGMSSPRADAPWWERRGIDLILVALAAIEYTRSALTNFQVVVAPEGVVAASVSYEAFVAPLCAWAGGTLLAGRLARAALKRARGPLAALLRPLAGPIAPPLAAALVRDRTRLAAGAMTVALAVAFAVSVATFAATYDAQARIDAELTNGSDVKLAAGAGRDLAALVPEIRKRTGVAAVTPLLHRPAYVGSDLQDLFGIDRNTIAAAAPLRDAFFAGGMREALAALGAHDDAILVSDETANDYALHPGDLVRLRLRDARGRWQLVPFRFAGIVREFPTAPKDAFLVANASYVAAATHDPRVDTLLVRAAGDPAALANALTPLAAAHGARLDRLDDAMRRIGANLVAVDLRGLARIELAAGFVLVLATAGLLWALEIRERRRSAAVLGALGAPPRTVLAVFAGEGLVRVVFGCAAGAVLGAVIANILVRLLTGVFDPPPESATYPAGYLIAIVLGAAVAGTVAVVAASESVRRAGINALEPGA
jgi:putative ABC transport system permease protein